MSLQEVVTDVASGKKACSDVWRCVAALQGASLKDARARRASEAETASMRSDAVRSAVNTTVPCGKGNHTPLTLCVRMMYGSAHGRELLKTLEYLLTIPEVDADVPYTRYVGAGHPNLQRTALDIANRFGLPDAVAALQRAAAFPQLWDQWGPRMERMLEVTSIITSFKTGVGLGHGLYLGSMCVAQKTKGPEVAAVLNCAANVQCNAAYHSAQGQRYHAFSAEDSDSYPLLECHLDEAMGFIDSVLNAPEPGTVFVHCFAGINRSACICVAYLMARFNYTLANAVAHVHARRPFVLTNVSFRQQLLRLAVKLGLDDLPPSDSEE